jgi:hypothetical protein
MFPVDLNSWSYVQLFPWYPWGIGYRVCPRIPNSMDSQDPDVKCHSICTDPAPTPMYFNCLQIIYAQNVNICTYYISGTSDNKKVCTSSIEMQIFPT